MPRSHRNPPGIAILIVLAIIAASAVVGGVGVAAYKNGSLAPPTEAQKHAIEAAGASVDPLTGGLGTLISGTIMSVWNALATPAGIVAAGGVGAAVVATSKKRKAEKATSELWNATPEGPGPTDSLHPSVLATIHAIDSKATVAKAVRAAKPAA